MKNSQYNTCTHEKLKERTANITPMAIHMYTSKEEQPIYHIYTCKT